MRAATAYLTILATSVAGLLGAPWVFVIVGACLLSLLSFMQHRHYRARFAAVSMNDVYIGFEWGSVGASFASALASYILGLAVHYVMLGSFH